MERGNIEMWQVITVVALRYFVFAGLAYLVFYIWKKRSWFQFKIQQRFPKPPTVRTELKYSLFTMLIFGAVIYISLFSPLRAYTKIYTDFYTYSLAYYFASLLLVIFIHDTYFYWTHRLMHHKKVFPYVHHIHHKSHNPTPLAAFSFHPLEAIIEVGVLPLIVFLLPVHRSVLLVFGLYMIINNVIGHLGYELYPQKFLRHKIFRWFTTSTHHNMHHHYSKCNYGLYFNIWDRLMNTNHARYEQEFEQVTSRHKAFKETKIPHLNTKQTA